VGGTALPPEASPALSVAIKVVLFINRINQNNGHQIRSVELSFDSELSVSGYRLCLLINSD
jgi:hypothetical protein